MNQLQLRYDTTNDQISLRPYIDGHDLLADCKNDRGRDPDDLLPPSSSRLFPTSEGATALIGMCSCGETGCGALTVRIRRVGAEVVWEPDEGSLRETLTRRYRFELTRYLDAVDGAGAAPPVGEGQGRRVARSVRLMLGVHDQRYDSLMSFRAKIDWIAAWPWTSDVIKASVSTVEGQTVLEFSANLDESEHQLAARIADDLNRRRYYAD